MGELTIKYNELTAEEFISLWESVWEGAPPLEQVKRALENTPFRVSVYDGEKAVGMARIVSDMMLECLIKDVAVRPEYQGKGIGRMMIVEIMKFVNENGINGTGVFVELCAEPEKAGFYEKLGFEADSEKRLKMMYWIKNKE